MNLGPIHLAWPWVLLAWPLLLWLCRRPSAEAPVTALPFTSLRLLRDLAHPVPARPSAFDRLRALALSALLLALAQPAWRYATAPSEAEGIDILLLVDASRSMDTRDYQAEGRRLSRLEAVREVVTQLIRARPQDRLGVLAFAEKPYLVSPLTLDHTWIDAALAQLQTTLGTAIGSSIEAGCDLLAAGRGRSRVMILLTDGLNTSGSDPLAAARLAGERGLRIYTIEMVTYDGMHESDLAAHPLAQIARLSGGQFFQAPDAATLAGVYARINQLERSRLEQLQLVTHRPLFLFPLLVAAAAGAALFWRRLRREGGLP